MARHYYLSLLACLLALCATSAPAGNFKVRSDVLLAGKFKQENLLAEGYGFGCTGENLSPDISWSDAPSSAKSFVVNIHDIDAKTGVGWMHWVVVNIPGSQLGLAAGIASKGAGLPPGAFQTRTDFGVPGYGGPCPPKGKVHRYRITVTALDVERLPESVGPEATPALVGFFANQHSVGQAVLEIAQGR